MAEDWLDASDAASGRQARHYARLLVLLSVGGTVAAALTWLAAGLAAAALAYALTIVLLYVIATRVVSRRGARAPQAPTMMQTNRDGRHIRR